MPIKIIHSEIPEIAPGLTISGPLTWTMTSDRLVGRDSIGSGPSEEIVLTGNLEWTGAGGIQRGALTGDVTAAAGSAATTIPSNTITFAKLQDIATQRVIGRNTGGTGDPEEVTATQALDWIGSTQGQVMYRGASAWAVLAPGVAGQVLQTGGAAADPSWLTLPAGGALTVREVDLAPSVLTVTVLELDQADGFVVSGAAGVARVDLANVPGSVLADGGVTLAKMADLTTDRLIGRDTAGTGVSEALTVGGGVEFTGSGGIQRSALTGDVTATAGSNSTTIANDAVTYAKIQNVAADARVLGRATGAGAGDVTELTGAQVATIIGAQTPAAHAASHAPGGSDVLQWGTDRLMGRDTAGTGDVELITVGDGLTFTGAGGIGIANDGVTYARIQNVTDARILGRSAESNGDVQEITVSAPLLLADADLGFDAAATLSNNARVMVRKNGGADVGARRRLNLIEGANVTLTVTDDAAGEEVDITIASSGGGGASATTVETNFGSTPVWRGSFTITDAAIASTSKVLVWQAPGPYTGKGTRADEGEMEPICVVTVIPATGSAAVKWEVAQAPVPTWDQPNGARSILAQPGVSPQSRVYMRRSGRVKGNFKFSYTVFA